MWDLFTISTLTPCRKLKLKYYPKNFETSGYELGSVEYITMDPIIQVGIEYFNGENKNTLLKTLKQVGIKSGSWPIHQWSVEYITIYPIIQVGIKYFNVENKNTLLKSLKQVGIK